MAELVPIPLPLLLRRAFLEYRGEGKIFDLPKSKFFLGLPGLDTSVSIHGRRAFTPVGPAAGPQGQMAQNIVLCWLAGARVIELKTVQILDELQIPRPCIDIPNVGYNVEWSQELKLEQSLREYVKAAMLIEILKTSKLLGETPEGWGDTIFDMSVGYSLEGIRSPRMRRWLEGMKDARPVIDELRAGIGMYRDLPFPARISDTASLSTFHGCPPGEIEGIVRFLLAEMDLDVCVKLNPTLLGLAEVDHILHEILGYRHIQLCPKAFEKDLQWPEALDLIAGLDRFARARGRSLSVKFSNTLVVRNHRGVFKDELMYLSGAPLHPLAMLLVNRFRERMGDAVPISFSAGLDANNIADAVAMNLIPATVCSDLLRPGGYGRMYKYLQNLGARMRAAGAGAIPDFITRSAPPAADLSRYSFERNRSVPRKTGSRLQLFDCINCDKCISSCPNDANFVYETPDGKRQIANFADACNECGNCDVFCPEEGAPFLAKPRFFGSLESYRKHADQNGYYIDWAASRIYGTIGGRPYELDADVGVGEAVAPVYPYSQLQLLYDSMRDSRRIHFANVAGIQEAPI